ncbi:M23 family metallopeptidase [Pedobacter psychroterrae]|uniref:M23 family peptidase n=1 Tax=Pedobacter psychroterrae TaxID=2530453 RepID=A0A4R0NFD4_9SPHI|nr:peptidoglycan DD-metalloendopeptidase family protein [Pedobacter psychroterrae]TCC97344.1 M23 family peptidase [Pedobacter psychroterrae]
MIALLLNIFLITFIANPTIESDKARWKPYYLDIAPSATATDWYLPFELANRKDMKQIKVISIFGDHRDSFLKSHIHTAIDINPAKPIGKLVSVYAMATGIVCSVHLGENQKTVVVRHKLADGSTMFTSYKHLKEVYVQQGQQVGQKTKLARLFTVQESKKYRGDYHHLHLEIRKAFDDYGCASWLTMNKQQLNLRFYNPMTFLKEKL